MNITQDGAMDRGKCEGFIIEGTIVSGTIVIP